MAETLTTMPAALENDAPATGLPDLVNRLTQELAHAQRVLGDTQQKLGSASRSLGARTQELTEARAALALLLATLDSASDGILAVGYFGRAMHYNARFIDMWKIGQEKLADLNESALLAMQLSQVRDPEAFLAATEARKARPDEPHASMVEMTDGRILACHVLPQRVRGKRVGTVTRYHDVTENQRLARVLAVLEAGHPDEVAEAKASTW